jgi:hypothetical protein
MRRQLRCAEVWGGVRHEDVDACSATVDASLFSLAADPADLFGLERLLGVLNADPSRSTQGVKHAVLNALLAHTGGSLAHDDVTLLVAEMR